MDHSCDQRHCVPPSHPYVGAPLHDERVLLCEVPKLHLEPLDVTDGVLSRREMLPYLAYCLPEQWRHVRDDFGRNVPVFSATLGSTVGRCASWLGSCRASPCSPKP